MFTSFSVKLGVINYSSISPSVSAVGTTRFGGTNPYTRFLLDAKTLAAKEPMYRLVHPNRTTPSVSKIKVMFGHKLHYGIKSYVW